MYNRSLYNNSNVFRRAVLNPDFEAEFFDRSENHYSKAFPFSFQTDFYRTPYSYCCCPCAYQHEYFDYLSDNDGLDQLEERHILDEVVFERIIQNIGDGRCPHVDKVEPKYLTTSAIYMDNILAASGSREAFIRIMSWTVGFEVSSIYNIHPFANIVLKNSCRIPDLVEQLLMDPYEYSLEDMKIMYPIRLKDNYETVQWERLPLFDCCARKRNSNGFQYLLTSLVPFSCNYMSTVYDLALKYDLRATLDSLIVNGIKWTAQDELYFTRNDASKVPERLILAEAAIVYNHPKVLDLVIPKLDRTASQMQKEKMVFISLALKRMECRKVLLKYGFPKHDNLPGLDQQGELFHILLNYSCCRGEIVSIIQRYEKISPPSIKNMIWHDYEVDLNCLIKPGWSYCRKGINSVEFLQLMTLGEDIDLTKLKTEHLDDIFRELVELCLFFNLSNLDKLADQTVSIYLKYYSKTDLKLGDHNIDLIFKESHHTGTIGGEYTMDANVRFLFGGENFALNFILPLFIECGFPLKRSLLDNILQDEKVSEKLHPAETEYLKKSLECPRSLLLCCRDSLRRHFKNRQIHQYVSISDVPNTLKDFVLLKTVLPTLKNTAYKQSAQWGKEKL